MATYLSPDSIWTPQPVAHFARNTKGRDWVLGDLHGRKDLVLDFIRESKFNPEIDRLFAVGDLTDRGAEGLGVLRFNHPDAQGHRWFFSVRGNHCQALLDFHYDTVVRQKMAADPITLKIGSRIMKQGWFMDLTTSEQREALLLAYDLPIAIEVETPQGLHGIVHASVPPGQSWNKFTSALKARDLATWECALWSREDPVLEGVKRLYRGHTIQEQPEREGKVRSIDTAAFRADRGKGTLTAVELDCPTEDFEEQARHPARIHIIRGTSVKPEPVVASVCLNAPADVDKPGPGTYGKGMELPPATIEYGNPLAKSLASKQILLAEAPSRRPQYCVGNILFSHNSAGYVPAGSAMRWDNEQYRVNWTEKDGTRHGRAFKMDDLAGAEAYFDQVRDPAKEATRHHEAPAPRREIPHLSEKLTSHLVTPGMGKTGTTVTR